MSQVRILPGHVTELRPPDYRQLAQTNPTAHLPDLAVSLNNFGALLDAVSRSEEALVTTKEAIEYYRQLTQTNPGTYSPKLAMALNNLGNQLATAGQREEAEAARAEVPHGNGIRELGLRRKTYW